MPEIPFEFRQFSVKKSRRKKEAKPGKRKSLGMQQKVTEAGLK